MRCMIFIADAFDRREIDQLGVTRVRVLLGLGGTSTYTYFDVAESDAAWPAVRDWAKRRKPSDSVTTSFSKPEITAAGWLEVASDWHHGYPQPEDDFGYLEVTFDLTDYCAECGTGARQSAPFRMRGEPRWGRRAILQLNWEFGDYFVLPEVWLAVFKPHGVLHRPVTNRKGVELKTVVQLVVDEQIAVVTDGLTGQPCPTCGVTKYLPVTRGPAPALVTRPTGHMARTREWFGSGHGAYRAVLISRSLREALEANGVRGASVIPVAEGRRDPGPT